MLCGIELRPCLVINVLVLFICSYPGRSREANKTPFNGSFFAVAHNGIAQCVDVGYEVLTRRLLVYHLGVVFWFFRHF